MTDPNSIPGPAGLEGVLSGTLADVHPAAFGELADQAECALLGSKVQLATFADAVRQGFHQAWAQVPPALREALRNERDGDPVLVAAYRIGQLGFAQHLLDSALNRRADDDFEAVVNGDRHRALTQALAEGDDLPVAALAAASGLAEAEVRVRLSELVRKGAAEFVHAPDLRYFLTHAGKGVVTSANGAALPRPTA